jgi:predicted dehydrogenase
LPPVRLALIGFGYWGPNYARVLSDLPGADLTVICDPRADRLELVRQRYPSVAACASLDQVYARDDVDAVVIATPASTHEALVRVALGHGRHVLVEKPMSLTGAGCGWSATPSCTTPAFAR